MGRQVPELPQHGQWWCLPAHHEVRRAAKRDLAPWPSLMAPRLRRLHGMSCRRLLEPHLDHRGSLTLQELATRNSARLHEKTASDDTLHNTTKATLPTKTLFATRMVNAFAVEASCDSVDSTKNTRYGLAYVPN